MSIKRTVMAKIYTLILMTIYRAGYIVDAFRLADKWSGSDGSLAQYDAAWNFSQRQATYPLCGECDWYVKTNDAVVGISDLHQGWCEQQTRQRIEGEDTAWAEFCVEEEARMAAERLEDELLQREADDAIDAYQAERDSLGGEYPEEFDDSEDDECPGGCGQPAYACVCAELESLRRYNATPLEERCGPWTA